MAPQQPTMGRIVRYVLTEDDSTRSGIRPAMVTCVAAEHRGGTLHEDVCNLSIFVEENDGPGHVITPLLRKVAVCHDENKMPGTWHWPERT